MRYFGIKFLCLVGTKQMKFLKAPGDPVPHVTSMKREGWNLSVFPLPTHTARLSGFPRASSQSKLFVYKYIKLHIIFTASPEGYHLISLCSFLSEQSGH